MKPTEKTKKNSSKVSSRLSLGERVPRLRFPGFDGEWEAKTFSEIADGFDYGINAAAVEFNGKHKYIRITDIDDTSHKFIGNPCVSPSGEIEEKYKVQIGDILLARTGASVGKSYLYDVCDGELYFAGFLIRARVNPKYDPRFVFYITCTPTYARWVSLISMRSGQPGINAEEYSQYKLFIPEGKERTKIADFLSFLDSRIAAQRKLVELLKKHKRGLIKHLFRPIEHTKWKSVRLGDVGTFQKGAPLSKADISKDGKPFILYGELYTTYGEIIKDVVRRTTAEIDISYLSRCGDVIIPTSGETAEEIATASCVMSDGVVLGGDLNIYRSEHIDGRFLAYAVRYIISRDISRIAQGVSVVHISATELKRISVSIPSKDEQIRIISVLENYDNRILHSYDILKKLEVTKDGLLQQLFV